MLPYSILTIQQLIYLRWPQGFRSPLSDRNCATLSLYHSDINTDQLSATTTVCFLFKEWDSTLVLPTELYSRQEKLCPAITGQSRILSSIKSE